MMKHALKRPIKTYLIQALLIFVPLSASTVNSSELGQWMLRLLALAGLGSLIYIIIRKNYFEVVDNKLVIHESVFMTRTIDLDKIEKFDIEPHPFTSSKIVLKDKTKIKYLDWHINDKKLQEFMGQFNIRVE